MNATARNHFRDTLFPQAIQGPIHRAVAVDYQLQRANHLEDPFTLPDIAAKGYSRTLRLHHVMRHPQDFGLGVQPWPPCSDDQRGRCPNHDFRKGFGGACVESLDDVLVGYVGADSEISSAQVVYRWRISLWP